MSDLISRKKLLEQIQADSEGKEGQYGDDWLFIDTINAIPTAEPKVGKWIELNKNEDGTHNIQCTYCRGCIKSKGHANSFHTAKHFSYCPHCGAEMRTEF